MLSEEEVTLIGLAQRGLGLLEDGDFLTHEDKAALTHLAAIDAPRKAKIDVRSDKTDVSPDHRGQNIDKKI